jgi:hypothetical protein
MSCHQCSCENKQNNHLLDPLLCPITYDSSEIITNFCLPRKYTNTHNDQTREIYISVGKCYNKNLLSSPEAVNVESQIIGKWVQKKNKYQIILEAIVSSTKNPQSEIRNTIICNELGFVLQGIALAETALLKLHPKLGKTKIYVHFKSNDKAYDRVEYWGKLKYWC